MGIVRSRGLVIVCAVLLLAGCAAAPRQAFNREAHTELISYVREAARAVLPNDTETKIVVSGNYRAWRDFIAQRWTVHADLEIQPWE